MPTVAKDRVIGVRTPQLRALAKELAGREDIADFLDALPHRYYEENNLHAFLLCELRNLPSLIARLDAFLPLVDNWATCDQMRPRIKKRDLPDFLPHLRRYLASGETYAVRFAIEMLMAFYLDDAYAPEYPAWVAAVRSEAYYVNMMVAWYFATAFAKRYEEMLPYLTERKLPVWTHNKTIQKCIESNRISEERKAELRALKRKEK